MSALRRAWAPFARLNGVDWAQLHAKLWGAAWPVVLFFVTPRVLGDALGPLLLAVLCSLMLIGSLTSAVGRVFAARKRDEPLATALPRVVNGLLTEFVGLMLMLVAVTLYGGSQAALAFGPDGTQRSALAVLGGFVAALVLGMIVSVLHRRRKEIATAKSAGVVL